jgi:ABC-type uncharacterized transport system involved in gliding motility, auxiliary component
MVKEEIILKKQIKYGLKSSITILIVIAFLICLNLFVNKFDLKYDLTKEKLYTVSEQTKKIIDNVNQKINIYVLASKENTNLITTKLIEQYKTKNINVEYKDTEKYPDFVKKFETTDQISPNSIIVSGENKYKVIDFNDLVSYDYDYSTFQTKVKSIDVEPELTNAIRYVTSNQTPVIYKLIGHGEQNLNEDYKKQIELANYEIKDLDLIGQTKIPDDCKIIFITTPQRDWTQEEMQAIDKFLQDGSAIFCIDYVKDEFINMTSLMKKYNFEFGKSIIIENNSSNFTGNNNLYLIPNYTENEISHEFEEKHYKLLVPFCQNIFINDDENIKALLESSDNSYGKTNLESQSITKEANDIDGPLNIAVLAEKENSKIIAIGSTSILDSNINSYVGGTNCDFIISSINYLNGQSDNLYIPPKTHETNHINFTQKQIILISTASTLLFPCIIFIIGIVIIRKRRQK